MDTMAETIKAKADRLMRDPHIAKAVMDRQEPTNMEFLNWLKDECPELHARWMAGPRFEIGGYHSAEEVKTIYDALRTYLHLLIQQPAEDYEEIARTTKLIIAIKPQAVEASQEIANRTVTS